jgi:FtsP/CotA-like multicopper oxidase with cupredoxin domain
MRTPPRVRGFVAVSLLLAAATAGAQSGYSGRTRVYYIAADEVAWNYVPGGADAIAGRPFQGIQTLWTVRGPTQIGTEYRKALYREYTDSSFRTLKPRDAKWEHLGFLGPVVRAEVGDSIRIVFRNNATHAYSVHPHGVLYDKSSEGAIYEDGTSGAAKYDDGVKPGGTYTYRWSVTERAGPGPMDGSSVLWMYHSHVDEAADVNAGLFGPMIVTARGKARADGSPTDVDRELVLAFAEIDENLSHYIDANIRQYADPTKVKRPLGPSFVDPFGITNLRETINGFQFGSGPMPVVQAGERVRWYLLSTTNFELHAPHWHGQVVLAQHMKMDNVTLGTMAMLVADMVPDNVGVWLFHCHIEPHNTGGMATRFRVEPAVTAAGSPRR